MSDAPKEAAKAAGKRAVTHSARALAARVLGRVQRKGEFAAAALDEELRLSQLVGPDRGLATELVYGVLRTRGVLTQRLNGLATRGIAAGDPRVLDHLLIAAYQLSFLQRVPDFAAVNEAVELVQRERDKHVAGFCNAVLRRYAQLPRPTLASAILQSAPAWLVAELTATVGEAEMLQLLGASEQVGPNHGKSTWLRLRKGTPLPDWAAQASRGQVYPDALGFVAAGDLRSHPEFAAGKVVIQDEGSMFAAIAVGAQAGEKVLDACAGRGHKASLLAEQLEPGSLWVSDLSQNKLNALQREFARLGLPAPQVQAADLSKPNAELPRDFDRVLVDAPCTGTGTLRKRPEIALRLTPEDVERLAQLAESILRNAAAHVRVGGRVVYVVCSVLARENEAVVERVRDVLTPAPFDIAHPALSAEQTQLRLLPGKHGSDGFFIASFVRSA